MSTKLFSFVFYIIVEDGEWIIHETGAHKLLKPEHTICTTKTNGWVVVSSVDASDSTILLQRSFSGGKRWNVEKIVGKVIRWKIYVKR